MPDIQIWELRQPDAAAAGLPFARGRLDATDRMIVHAAPSTLEVEVRSDDGQRLALGESLQRTDDCPMAMLTVQDGAVRRQDRWPTPDDIGTPVILPGGEVGILTAWEHAEDGSSWRWSVEFYNAR
jgi:hypothetical protein